MLYLSSAKRIWYVVKQFAQLVPYTTRCGVVQNNDERPSTLFLNPIFAFQIPIFTHYLSNASIFVVVGLVDTKL
jgi:hypothetical protein